MVAVKAVSFFLLARPKLRPVPNGKRTLTGVTFLRLLDGDPTLNHFPSPCAAARIAAAIRSLIW